jgi:hypothetical protein
VKTHNSQFSHKRLMSVLGAALMASLTLTQLYADAPTISGFIATSYNYNFNKPLNGTTALRSYDAKHNNITLNTVHLNFNGGLGDNLSYVIETDYGVDPLTTTSTGSGAFDVQEAYFVYKCPVTKLNLRAGKFVTPHGIEVIETKDNPTISRGYLFGLAEPYTHAGAMLGYSFGEKIMTEIGVVNGWDVTSDNNKGKTLCAKVGVNLGYHGPEQTDNFSSTTTLLGNSVDGRNRSTVDLTGVTKIIPRLALWFQVNYGQEEKAATDPVTSMLELATWGGGTIQPVVSITDKFSLGGRWEVFEDPDGARTGTRNVSARNIAVVPSYKMTDNLTVRAEYRNDSSNKKLWMDDKGVMKDSASTTSVEFVVTF